MKGNKREEPGTIWEERAEAGDRVGMEEAEERRELELWKLGACIIL